MLIIFGTTDYVTVFHLIPLIIIDTANIATFNCFIINILAIFIIIGAFGKSAQIGFHT